jgi:hypothetical protein
MHVVVMVTFGEEQVRIWVASVAAERKDRAVLAGSGD